MDERDITILEQIKIYCDDIFSFVDRFGADFSVFANDRAYYNAVSMCLLQIGELSGKLSPDFRSQTSEDISWASIRGMRNIVAHDYSSFDEGIAWNTVVNDIPILSKFCDNRLEQFEIETSDIDER